MSFDFCLIIWQCRWGGGGGWGGWTSPKERESQEKYNCSIERRYMLNTYVKETSEMCCFVQTNITYGSYQHKTNNNKNTAFLNHSAALVNSRLVTGTVFFSVLVWNAAIWHHPQALIRYTEFNICKMLFWFFFFSEKLFIAWFNKCL